MPPRIILILIFNASEDALRGCWTDGRTWTMSIIQIYLIQN